MFVGNADVEKRIQSFLQRSNTKQVHQIKIVGKFKVCFIVDSNVKFLKVKFKLFFEICLYIIYFESKLRKMFLYFIVSFLLKVY